MRYVWIFGCTFTMCLLARSQEEVSIVATKDNTMYSENGNTSNGAGIYIFSGKTNGGAIRRALVQFDLTGKIPSNATITSVLVKLNMSRTIAGSQNATIHKVTADWGEGTSDALGNNGNEGSGAAATTNDATWSHRIFNTQQWTVQGGDFEALASDTTAIGSAGSFQFGSTQQMIADAQGWLANPGTNFGWLIKCNESANATAKRFDSREHTVAANRPTLIIQYTVPTGVKGKGEILLQFSLGQNFPNPFNPSTVIRYSLSTASHVSLKVFDILGKEMAVLVNERKEAGSFSYQWNTTGLPSGVYFYRLQAGNNTATKKLILAK